MNWPKRFIFISSIVAVITIISTLGAFSRRMLQKGNDKALFELVSSAFKNDEEIPAFYTCDTAKLNDGDGDVSPPLAWKNPPEGTKSFAVTVHDPGALGGDWIHWIVYDISPERLQLEEHVHVESIGAKLGINSWGETTYGGPCPPLKAHTYIFTVYALNIPSLDVKQPAEYTAVMKAMEGHVIEQALLRGTYQRTRSI